jgi:hypothetical protein
MGFFLLTPQPHSTLQPYDPSVLVSLGGFSDSDLVDGTAGGQGKVLCNSYKKKKKKKKKVEYYAARTQPDFTCGVPGPAQVATCQVLARS